MTQTATTTTLALPSTRIVTLPGGPEIELALIPAGAFKMGDVLERSPELDTRPAHEVELDAFYIARTAVTNEQFACFVAQTGYRTTREQDPRPSRDGKLPPV